MSAPRRFDHDEARRLRAEAGLSVAEIARRMGVTYMSVARVCDARIRATFDARHAEWQRGGVCVDCGGPCSRNSTRGVQRCRSCAAAARTLNVRDGELRCERCKEWKPDADFPKGAKAHRRHRHSLCRSCNTTARREYRDRVKVPCVECGAPCLPANESRAATGLCRPCYIASVSKRQAVTA